MAITKLDVNNIAVSISTNLTTPAWKEIVCMEDHTLDGKTNVTKRKTRCGNLTFTDSPEWSVTNSGAANLTPATGTEASVQELATIFQDQTPFLVKLEHRTDPTKYYRSGQGLLTSYTETGKQGDAVGFDFTIDVDGDLDLLSA
jgi:hypothetical protein